MLAAVLSVPLPIGSDYHWHLNIATMIADGNLRGAVDYLLSPAGNMFPYGFYVSVMHLFLVPTVWSGNPYFFEKVLQVLFLPLTLALTMWLVYKYASPKAAVYTGMALFGSWAFFDGAMQVRPESLDLLCYPLIVGAALSAKKWRFVGLAVFTVYGHGLAALSNVVGLALVKWQQPNWRRALTVGLIAIIPVLVVSALYVDGAFSKWGGAGLTENPQEVLFWTDPSFIPYYMGATVFGVPFLFKRGKSELLKLALWGLVGNLIMLPLWADRWLHYVSLPLAIFAGVGIAGLKKPEHRFYFAMALLAVFIVYVASYFSFSIGIEGHRFWQPGD